MSPLPFKKPVEDSVPMVNNELAVGEDLQFQRKWWTFEHVIWTLFTIIVILDLLGLFGRGFLAHDELHTADDTVRLKYDRIERYGTPSNITIRLGPAAIHNGKVQVLVSQNIITQLGAQRVSPEPAISSFGQGGVLYTFPALAAPATVQVALQPSKPGIFRAKVQSPGSEALDLKIFVLP